MLFFCIVMIDIITWHFRYASDSSIKDWLMAFPTIQTQFQLMILLLFWSVLF